MGAAPVTNPAKSPYTDKAIYLYTTLYPTYVRMGIVRVSGHHLGLRVASLQCLDTPDHG